ncbi:MAG TPA: DNA repair protein RecN [Coriobacteriia bacterium]|nr:DNA repair protein RecN [Coriobacteriia bacterium]
MLEELHVRDLALIEDVWIEFGGGLTVLTGETGAGKTVLLGALKLLLGERADSGAVRGGAAEALVEGRFVEAGDELVAKRRVSADGRSRCSLSGEMATVSALADRIGPLVDLHGQHEHQALLRTSTHAGYLDAWIGDAASAALDEYRSARSSHATAVVHEAQLLAALEEALRNADYLRFVVDEIEKVGPLDGEDDELEAALPALQHAERLADAAASAASALRSEGGAADRVSNAMASLAKVDGIDASLDEIASRLEELQLLLDDAGSSLRAYRDGVTHDPAVLEATLARLSALSGLKKKYGPSLAEVQARYEQAVAGLAAVSGSDEALREARETVATCEAVLRERAGYLASVRRDAAPLFVEALRAASVDLAMPDVSFEVAFGELPFEQWTEAGPARIEFLYSPAAGQAARPLAKIASGGEISRVMLALKGVLGRADESRTLVFDEIDAGIGGSTADAVGRRLALLARTHQVIVVTHLAQVAAYANRQVVVSKSNAGTAASTTVAVVEGDARVAEIARMLSGNDSDVSTAHARELLDAAREALNAVC